MARRLHGRWCLGGLAVLLFGCPPAEPVSEDASVVDAAAAHTADTPSDAAPRVCGTDPECADDDPCTVGERCVPATRTCLYATLDGDADGSPPRVCGGEDCDDSRADVSPSAAELCNGVDDDCDSRIDEAPASASCGAASSGCVAGVCGCAATEERCEGTCIDTRTSDAHCGRCDGTCLGGPGPRERCVDSECVSCGGSGQTCCAGSASSACDEGNCIDGTCVVCDGSTVCCGDLFCQSPETASSCPFDCAGCRTPEGTCALDLQDCPDGQACIYGPTGSGADVETQCAAQTGPLAREGASCCGIASCERGLVCMGFVDGAGGACTTSGRCRRYCCDDTGCDDGEACEAFEDRFSGGFCSDPSGCSLVRQTGCAGGEGCYPALGGLAECMVPTDVAATEGESCSLTNDCVPGLGCFVVGGTSRCLAFCWVADGAAGCASRMSCFAASDLPAGIGVCPPS